MQVTRRGLLIGAALGGGVLVAWTLMPREFESPLSPGPGEAAYDAWLKIAADGVVTVAVPQLEMGQGVTTLLPQIVAMELGADWRQVAVEPAPVSGAYANVPLAARWAPLWRPLLGTWEDEPDELLLQRWAQDNRFTATAEGTALPAYETACRNAGAAARTMLAMAAADRWDVSWEQCRAENGFIYHDANRASFAELALEAASQTPPDPPPLLPEPPAEPVIAAGGALGREEADRERVLAWPRLDLPSKVDGSHVFAADVRLPDMVYAAIRHGPHDRAELLDFDAAPAAGRRGLLQLVRSRRWLAAVADTWWTAEEVLKAIAPRFSVEEPVQGEAMARLLDDRVRRGVGETVAELGEGVEDYVPDLALRFDVAPGLHATIETTSATARLIDGKLELWLATQTPESARAAAAGALGIGHEDVILYPVAAGGSFDRRLDNQAAIEVALLARETGRPVQLTWSRWQEHVAAYPRAPVAALIGAELGAEGSILALRARVACPSTMHELGRRMFDNRTSWAAIDASAGMVDPMATEGLLSSYAFPRATVQHIPVRLKLPTTRMRGGAHGYTAFFRESFLDEAAKRHEREPLSYRIAMLGQDPRMVAVLQAAAQLAAWDGGGEGGGLGGAGQGLACHRMDLFGASGRIAVIAEAARGEGGLRVRKLFAAADIGRVVNRDIALQQIEGGLIFGLAMALGCDTDYADGLPTNARLAALAMPGMAECPEIHVSLLASSSDPFDPGEIGVPAVAPAIANAFHAATGLRLTRLPLLSALT